MSIYGETPSGAVNGTNKVFATSQPYVTGSTRVYENGERLHLGVDYTESAASTLTFTNAPASGAVLLVDYDITASGVSYPVGEWTFNPEGYAAGAALYNGPTLFPGGLNPGETQTAVCVFGPNGAVVNVPPVFDGPPGEPALFDSASAATLSPGSPATVEITPLSPGGPGQSSHYALAFGIPQGQPGAPAPNTLINPQPVDLEGTPLAGYMIGYDATNTKAQWQPIPFAAVYNVTGIPTTGPSAGEIRTLETLTIQGRPTAYVPIVFASCEVSGTANTQVDLVARLNATGNNTQTGTEIGRGFGTLGATPPPPVIGPEGTGLFASGYGKVPANTEATIFLNAEDQASTNDEYSTGRCRFTVWAIPVAS
ncbi:hypothetical protein [Mycobacterium celatum]|uniref:hypothetical protein n=1 Tax=Mycobacterium celatum TaxID=28045 RepID=UPI001156635D|nr:hypothetical protein [Mycobacterium celatum]